MEKDSFRKSGSTAVRSHLLKAIIRIAAFIAVTAAVNMFLFGAFTVPDNGMFPQIHAGDLMVFFIPEKPGRHDTVIYETSDGLRAGRIAASPGDTVDQTDSGLLKINGILQTVQEREGIYCETETRKGNIRYPFRLGEDEFFILGDNRDSAMDSRVLGKVKKSEIKGVVFMLIRRQAV